MGSREHLTQALRGRDREKAKREKSARSPPVRWASNSLPDLSSSPPPGMQPMRRAQCTQTKDGQVHPEGKPRKSGANVLLSAPVPSKAACFSDMRLFQLVREGTYDEVLKELEQASHDPEAAWIKTKLLRLIQKHRQKTYGSIRNPTTSGKKELTPDTSASTLRNLDEQLPSLERPSAESVVMKMMHDLAVLHNLRPRPLAEKDVRPIHEQIYVPEQAYVEKELSCSRASSPLASRATSPVIEAVMPENVLAEVSSSSIKSYGSSHKLADFSDESLPTPKQHGGVNNQSAPSFVNREHWLFQSALPANDASRRDRRLNSPVGDSGNRTGDWSRISYTSLNSPSSHTGISALRRPHDASNRSQAAAKPGIDSQGIKTMNSKEFDMITSLLESFFQTLSQSACETTQTKQWLDKPPKMGSVRNVRECAKREAECSMEHNRTQRLKELNTRANEVLSRQEKSSDILDRMTLESIQRAQDLWDSSMDATPSLDAIGSSRLNAAKQLLRTIEKYGRKKDKKYKKVIQEIMSQDLIGPGLHHEMMTVKGIAQTVHKIKEHAAELSSSQYEKAGKKLAAAKLVAQRAEVEMIAFQERLDNEMQVANLACGKLAEIHSERDQLEQKRAEQSAQMNEQRQSLAVLKAQVMHAESQAYEASQQGKEKDVKEHKAKSQELGSRAAGVRTMLEETEEGLTLLESKLGAIEKEIALIESVAQKDQARVEEAQIICTRHRTRMKDLEQKVRDEEKVVEDLSERYAYLNMVFDIL
jgi:hypothetical protein